MIQREQRRTDGDVRSDAARNRRSITAAASEVFALYGEKADVREIASRAGVGMGTLYRHFATKEELLETVLELDFIEWTHAAREAAEAEPDPARALSCFLRDALHRQGRHRALSERFAATKEQPLDSAACRQNLYPIMEELVARCKRAGVIRSDATGQDIATLLTGLGAIARLAAEQQRPELPIRALDIVLDGLRLDHPSRQA